MSTPRNLSVLRAFKILKSFHHPDEWVAGCDLSRRAKIPEATTYRLIRSLELVGAVVKDEEGQYRCALFSMPGHQNPLQFGARETSLDSRLETEVVSQHAH